MVTRFCIVSPWLKCRGEVAVVTAGHRGSLLDGLQPAAALTAPRPAALSSVHAQERRQPVGAQAHIAGDPLHGLPLPRPPASGTGTASPALPGPGPARRPAAR